MPYLCGLGNHARQLVNLLLILSLVSCIRATPQPNQPPSVNAGPDQTVTLPGTADLNGLVSDDGLPRGSALTASWSTESGPGTVVFDNPNMTVTSATFSAAGTYVLRLSASDSQLTSSDDVTITVNATTSLPPDPATVASPVDQSEATTLGEATEFLYNGANPIQTGVSPGTIEPKRAAVLRGQINDRNGAPLPGVTITVLDHTEYGQTLSRADGIFDLAVNGSGLLTIQYEKDGYLPVQRQVQAPWQDYAWLPDVVMIPVDDQVTTIDLGSLAPIQVARGSVISDTDGVRQPTLLFPQGISATMMLPGGITQSLSILQVRATEYTVGSSGPEAMPAELPPASGYTHAIEFTVDEAAANGVKVNGKDVFFSQPVFYYIENFLNFPVGIPVPTGYYDNDRAVWVPSDNGRVIKVLNISGGLADLDIDGSNAAASAVALAEMGVTDAERQQLASLYAAGMSLWRVPLTNFSTWDFNWGNFGDCDPRVQSCSPPPPGGSGGPPEPDPCKQDGSTIECQNQILGERIDLVGMPFNLHYRSDRVPGRGRTLPISVSGATVPDDLKRIELEILVAGQQITQTFAPNPNQTYTFQWDGRDIYGRLMQGAMPITIRIGYVYDGWYMYPPDTGRAFGRVSDVPILQAHTRDEYVVFQQFQDWLFAWDSRGQGLGAWTLDVQHVYDPNGQMLYLGDGRRRNAANLPRTITTFAGTGVNGYSGDGGLATSARVSSNVRGIAVDGQGSLYLSDWSNNRIRKVSADGIIATIAGTGTPGFSGDGSLAINAQLNGPEGIAIDGQGNLFVADLGNQRIRKIATNGIITTVAGNGVSGQGGGDGGPATQANLFFPLDVAVALDGTLYIAESGVGTRIRSVSPDGMIMTAVQSQSADTTAIWLVNPRGLVTDQQGNLFFPSHNGVRVYRLGSDGRMAHVAGGGTTLGDGGSATQARISAKGMAVDQYGNLFITDAFYYRIRKVSPEGIITSVAGSGTGTGPGGFGGDGGPATRAQLNQPQDVAVDEVGNLFIADTTNARVRKVGTPFPQFFGAIAIAAEDGSEVYVFDSGGRHLHTVTPLTAATLYTFTYDAGRLETVTDGDGNITTIERDGDSNPTAIVGPYGQRTTLGLDVNGYLASVTNPANETTRMRYTAEGLLTHFIDPRGNTAEMHYDAMGRLFRDENVADGLWVLNRVEQTSSYSVTLTSSLSRTTTYQVENLPTGSTRRLNTFPSGLQTEAIRGTDGSRQISFPNGTVINLVEGPDPRWGMQAPQATSLTINTPGGLISTYTMTRTVALTDPTNLLSLVTMTDTRTINDLPYTSTYDVANQTFADTTPAGRQSTITIDTQSRVIQEQIAGLNPINYHYDSLGRLDSITQGSGAEERRLSFSYNSDGYPTTITDPLDHSTNLAYDDAGRVTQQTLADSRVISYTYDANGNLTSITPPGQSAHSFTYTPVNLPETYTPPDVGAAINQTQYIYNLDRQLDQIIRPDGQMVDPDYDSAGRLSSLTIPRGTVAYVYDPTTGNLATITAPQDIGLAYSYDGDLLTGVTWDGPVTGTVSYTYDNDFRLMTTIVNDDNPISFQYDPDGLLIQAGTLTLDRDPQNGLLIGSTLGTVTDTWGYNSFAEPMTYTAAYSGTNIFTRQYTRDKLGRISIITETIAGGTQTYGYTYDLVGRLIYVRQNGNLIATYGYDSNGNRRSYTSPGETIMGSYDDQDRLLLYGATTYTYTTNGELLSKTSSGQTTTYQYDALGNLIQVTLPGGTLIEYLVDGQNRRIGKHANDTLVQGFLYKDELNPIAELDGNNQIVSRFVYAQQEHVPTYMIKDGVTYYIVTDHLGSPRLVIDVASGSLMQRMDYDEFGNVITDTNPGFQPFGFAGGIYDRDTGLTRFGARDYDPEIGRWTTKDPFGFQGRDMSLYTYAYANPVSFIDPSGRVPPAVAAAVFLGVIVLSYIGQLLPVFFPPPAPYGPPDCMPPVPERFPRGLPRPYVPPPRPPAPITGAR